MKSIIIGSLIVFLTLFSGCSTDDSAAADPVDETPVDDGVVTMVTDTVYTISAGGVITRTSSEADVSVVTDLTTNVTTATLISGSATCTECVE